MKYNHEKKGYRLHAHVTEAILTSVEAKVSQAGRQRVIKEKQKNIHACLFCQSFYSVDTPVYDSNNLSEIYYNPYTQDSFTVENQPIETASIVTLTLKNNTPKAFLVRK